MSLLLCSRTRMLDQGFMAPIQRRVSLWQCRSTCNCTKSGFPEILSSAQCPTSSPVCGACQRPSPHAPTITACRFHLLVCTFYVQSLWLATLTRPLPSRPPLAARITADVAVVGGGFTGLWTAYHLTRLAPALRVVVLEAKHCGFGASGRNGGWVSAECVWGLMCLVHSSGVPSGFTGLCARLPVLSLLLCVASLAPLRLLHPPPSRQVCPVR